MKNKGIGFSQKPWFLKDSPGSSVIQFLVSHEASSATTEPVFILIDNDSYADDEKKRLVVTHLIEPPINFTLKRDLQRLGILYGDLDPINIPLAQEVVGVRSVTKEEDSGIV